MTALKTISRGAGFYTDLGRNVSRRRWLETDTQRPILPVCSVWMGDEEASPEQCMGSRKSRVPVVIQFFARCDKREDADRIRLRTEADIKSAMYASSTFASLGGVTVVPSKGVAEGDHQEFADSNIVTGTVGVYVDYTWTAVAP